MSAKAMAALVGAMALAGCASTQPQQAAPAPAPSTLSAMTGGRAPDSVLPRLIEEASRHPLGSQQNPVRVNMPPGERAYLNRLRCSDGSAPGYIRVGNGGPGVFGSIVDIYDVRCSNGEPRESQIWMDMYHPTHDETAAPPGFTIVP